MADLHYVWRGNDPWGQQQTGTICASSRKDALHRLRAQRIRITRLQRQYSLPSWLKFASPPRLHPRDITRLTRQLATLLHAGVPLLQALDILLHSETASATQALLRALYSDVERGKPFSQALRQHPNFEPLYGTLVNVGELTGRLDTMLAQLAEHLEKSDTLRAKLRTALTYPCAVLCIASAVLILILTFVVPAFQTLFASFGAELPRLTRWVMAASDLIQQRGLLGLMVIIFAALGIQQTLQRRPHWQTQWHRACLQMPIAGPLIHHACTARWTRTLATLTSAGVPLTDALTSVSGVTGNRWFETATQSIQRQLMQGASLSHALKRSGAIFPSMVIQMCAIGEESGALDHMLDKTAQHYEHEVDQTLIRLSTLLEPVIMVVLGLLIGGLVMALYLPIFQLGQVV
jgi:type IV pilus assembly protein PilC